MEDLEALKEYCEAQIEGINRSSGTDAGNGAKRAFVNVLLKIGELQKKGEKPKPKTLDELLEANDASERITAEDLAIRINT